MASLFLGAGADTAGSGLAAASLAFTAFITNTILPVLDTTTICGNALTGDQMNPVNTIVFGHIATVFCVIPEALNWFMALFAHLVTTPTLPAPPPVLSLSAPQYNLSVIPALVWSTMEYGYVAASQPPMLSGPFSTVTEWAMTSRENYWATFHEFPLFSLASDAIPSPFNEVAVYVDPGTTPLGEFMAMVGYPLALVAILITMTLLACEMEDKFQISGYFKRAARTAWSTARALTFFLVPVGFTLLERRKDNISLGVCAQAVLEQVVNHPQATGLCQTFVSWPYNRFLRLRISAYSTRVSPATLLSQSLPLASGRVELNGPHLLELGLRGFDRELVLVFCLRSDTLPSPPSAKRLPFTRGERAAIYVVDLPGESRRLLKEQLRNVNWGLCLCCMTLVACCAVVVLSIRRWMLVAVGIYACSRRFWNGIFGRIWDMIPLAAPSGMGHDPNSRSAPTAATSIETPPTPTSQETAEDSSPAAVPEAPVKTKKARKAHKKKRSPKPIPDSDPFASRNTMGFHNEARTSLPPYTPHSSLRHPSRSASRPSTSVSRAAGHSSATPAAPSPTSASRDRSLSSSTSTSGTPAYPSSLSGSTLSAPPSPHWIPSDSFETPSPVLTPEDGPAFTDVHTPLPGSASARTEVDSAVYHYDDSVHSEPLDSAHDKGKGRATDTVGQPSAAALGKRVPYGPCPSVAGAKREFTPQAMRTSGWNHSFISQVLPRSLLGRQPAERRALLKVVDDAKRDGVIPYKKRLSARVRQFLKREDKADDFNRLRASKFHPGPVHSPPRSPTTSPVRSRARSRSVSRSPPRSRERAQDASSSTSPIRHRGRAGAPSPSRSSPSRSSPSARGRAPSPSGSAPLDRGRSPSPLPRPARGRGHAPAPAPSSTVVPHVLGRSTAPVASPSQTRATAPPPPSRNGKLSVSGLRPPCLVPGGKAGDNDAMEEVVFEAGYLEEVRMAEPMDEDEWSQGVAQMELVLECVQRATVDQNVTPMEVDGRVGGSFNNRPPPRRIGPPNGHPASKGPGHESITPMEVDRRVGPPPSLQPLPRRIAPPNTNPVSNAPRRQTITPMEVDGRVDSSSTTRPPPVRVSGPNSIPVGTGPGRQRIPPTAVNGHVQVGPSPSLQPLLGRIAPPNSNPVSNAPRRQVITPMEVDRRVGTSSNPRPPPMPISGPNSIPVGTVPGRQRIPPTEVNGRVAPSPSLQPFLRRIAPPNSIPVRNAPGRQTITPMEANGRVGSSSNPRPLPTRVSGPNSIPVGTVPGRQRTMPTELGGQVGGLSSLRPLLSRISPPNCFPVSQGPGRGRGQGRG